MWRDFVKKYKNCQLQKYHEVIFHMFDFVVRLDHLFVSWIWFFFYIIVRFEQGVRAKVSEELTDLRHQQKTFCDNLEALMENAAEEEEQDEKEQQEQ